MMVKRQMFGPADLPLLRERLLLTAKNCPMQGPSRYSQVGGRRPHDRCGSQSPQRRDVGVVPDPRFLRVWGQQELRYGAGEPALELACGPMAVFGEAAEDHRVHSVHIVSTASSRLVPSRKADRSFPVEDPGRPRRLWLAILAGGLGWSAD
jgi:hypothetical protein